VLHLLQFATNIFELTGNSKKFITITIFEEFM